MIGWLSYEVKGMDIKMHGLDGMYNDNTYFCHIL